MHVLPIECLSAVHAVTRGQIVLVMTLPCGASNPLPAPPAGRSMFTLLLDSLEGTAPAQNKATSHRRQVMMSGTSRTMHGHEACPMHHGAVSCVLIHMNRWSMPDTVEDSMYTNVLSVMECTIQNMQLQTPPREGKNSCNSPVMMESLEAPPEGLLISAAKRWHRVSMCNVIPY